jgi:hypothetical protein
MSHPSPRPSLGVTLMSRLPLGLKEAQDAIDLYDDNPQAIIGLICVTLMSHL